MNTDTINHRPKLLLSVMQYFIDFCCLEEIDFVCLNYVAYDPLFMFRAIPIATPIFPSIGIVIDTLPSTTSQSYTP